MTDQADQEAMGLAGLWAAVHVLRIMINRGLVSPDEVDTVFQGVLDGLHLSRSRLSSEIESSIEEVFAQMRNWAESTWIGGPGDPGRLAH